MSLADEFFKRKKNNKHGQTVLKTWQRETQRVKCMIFGFNNRSAQWITVYTRSIVYVVLHKMGHYFLDRQYLWRRPKDLLEGVSKQGSVLKQIVSMMNAKGRHL